MSASLGGTSQMMLRNKTKHIQRLHHVSHIFPRIEPLHFDVHLKNQPTKKGTTVNRRSLLRLIKQILTVLCSSSPSKYISALISLIFAIQYSHGSRVSSGERPCGRMEILGVIVTGCGWRSRREEQRETGCES